MHLTVTATGDAATRTDDLAFEVPGTSKRVNPEDEGIAVGDPEAVSVDVHGIGPGRLRIALETQFKMGTPTGLGTYASGLARALQARDDVEVVELFDPAFDLWRFDRRVYWDQVRGPRLAARAGADVVHFTGGTLPLVTPRPVVLTVHDLVWLRGANRGIRIGIERRRAHKYAGLAPRRAAHQVRSRPRIGAVDSFQVIDAYLNAFL